MHALHDTLIYVTAVCVRKARFLVPKQFAKEDSVFAEARMLLLLLEYSQFLLLPLQCRKRSEHNSCRTFR